MNKKIRHSLTAITLSLIALLTGCNSEGAFNGSNNSNDSTKPEEGATLVEIIVSPSSAFVAHRGNTQLKAIGKYDNGTEVDVSNIVEWAIIGDPTLVQISSTGLVTAGTALGYVKVPASKDGIFSEEITVTVDDLAGPVIDIFDTGAGKLFISSPSTAYSNSIGGSVGAAHEENGSAGPAGWFRGFNWNDANTLCTTYSTKSIGGRTNWRLATKDELKGELYDVFLNMFTVRGWPTTHVYWSATPDGSSKYYSVRLYSGGVHSAEPTSDYYVSCVSEL